MAPRHLSARHVAELAGGELIGNADVILAGIAPLDRAGPGDLSILTDRRFLSAFTGSNAGAVLVSQKFRDASAGPPVRIVVPDPHQALVRVLAAFAPPEPIEWGIHPTATVGSGTQWSGRVAIGPYAVLGHAVSLGSDCIIGPHAIIGAGVSLGDHCRIGAHATLEGSTALGDEVVLNAGARVGTPGFGYAPTTAGHDWLPHLGRCVIGDRVEIGANTTVDRGSVDDTVIGADTKIDNLVQVAHNVRIGPRCLILAQVGIAGTTTIEEDAVLGGQAGLAGHLAVGRGARVAAQSGVIGDIPAGATVSGYPARSHRDVLRQAAALKRLTPIISKLERIASDVAPD
jgi:UDP-3-O-[3-hydroxymyristoyl] glucosamine N-acyltransferase